jgi:hypothetical protein
MNDVKNPHDLGLDLINRDIWRPGHDQLSGMRNSASATASRKLHEVSSRLKYPVLHRQRRPRIVFGNVQDDPVQISFGPTLTAP